MTTIKIKVETEIVVEPQHIDDLMVTALEGGINYWCRKAKIISCPRPEDLAENVAAENVLASDVISKGGVLEMYDAESNDKWELTLEKFLKGLKWYCEKFGYTDMEDLIDNHDADTADSIVQYALFDEIVFG